MTASISRDIITAVVVTVIPAVSSTSTVAVAVENVVSGVTCDNFPI